MVKITGIIHLTDDSLIRSKTAGGTDMVNRIVADFDVCAVDIQDIFLPFQINQNLIQMNGADFLLPCPADSLEIEIRPQLSNFLIWLVNAPLVIFRREASLFILMLLLSRRIFKISILTSQPSALKMSRPSLSEVICSKVDSPKKDIFKFI